MNDKYVLEWSRKQNAFHIQPEGKAVEMNLQALVSNYERDYATIAIGAREHCEMVAKHFRPYLKQREQAFSNSRITRGRNRSHG